MMVIPVRRDASAGVHHCSSRSTAAGASARDVAGARRRQMRSRAAIAPLFRSRAALAATMTATLPTALHSAPCSTGTITARCASASAVGSAYARHGSHPGPARSAAADLVPSPVVNRLVHRMWRVTPRMSSASRGVLSSFVTATAKRASARAVRASPSNGQAWHSVSLLILTWHHRTLVKQVTFAVPMPWHRLRSHSQRLRNARPRMQMTPRWQTVRHFARPRIATSTVHAANAKSANGVSAPRRMQEMPSTRLVQIGATSSFIRLIASGALARVAASAAMACRATPFCPMTRASSSASPSATHSLQTRTARCASARRYAAPLPPLSTLAQHALWPARAHVSRSRIAFAKWRVFIIVPVDGAVRLL